MIDRRNVLRAAAVGTLGAAGTVGTAALGGLPPAVAVTPELVEKVPPRAWQRLAAALSPGASLYRPSDPAYPPLALPFNHRYAGICPAGIVACATTHDVSTAIRWAREVGLPAVPRSGPGHNYAGYSTTTGLLLNMSRMKDITANPSASSARSRRYGPIEVVHEAGTVTVGAGVTNGDLHPLLENEGMFVPTGRCPSVGVAGLVLGGGIGFSDKMFGLTCDRLLATTVVLADGSVVEADDRTEPELFWACRGGAGNNFGVHTSFTFRYEQFHGNVGFYSLRWSLDSVLPVMAAMQRTALDTADNNRFHCRLGLATNGRTRQQIVRNANVNVLGQHYGTLDELRGILAPLLAIGTPNERARNRASLREVTPAEASTLLGHTSPVDCFAAKSAILGPNDLLTERQVQAAAELLRAWPGSGNNDGAGFAMFGLGGEINKIPPGATAFVHRDGVFILCPETSWADHDHPATVRANLRWLDDFSNAIFTTAPPARSYQNFPDPELKTWRTAYYGANYPRLVRAKQHYDPTRFFDYPQAI